MVFKNVFFRNSFNKYDSIFLKKQKTNRIHLTWFLKDSLLQNVKYSYNNWKLFFNVQKIKIIYDSLSIFLKICNRRNKLYMNHCNSLDSYGAISLNRNILLVLRKRFSKFFSGRRSPRISSMLLSAYGVYGVQIQTCSAWGCQVLENAITWTILLFLIRCTHMCTFKFAGYLNAAFKP